MPRWANLLLRLVAGFLVAGVIAPFTLKLPESWQGPSLLVGLAAVCVAAALVVGRQSRG